MHPGHAPQLKGPAGVAVMIVFTLEWFLLFVRPMLLARLAFIPVGHRFVALSRQTREGLIARAMDMADYRTAPVESFAPERLAAPETVALEGDKKLTFTPRGEIVVAPTFTVLRKQQQDVVRATLALETDRIVVRAKSYPSGTISLLVLMATILLSSHWPAWVAFAFFFGIVVMMIMRRRATNLTLDRIASEVSRRVERLAAARASEERDIRVAVARSDMPIEASSEDASRLQRPAGGA